MTNIIRSISYKNSRCHFQDDLKKDIGTVRNEDRIFVKADKSTNFYKLDTNQYNHLLNANVIKTYKKADNSKLDKIDKEAKNITTKLDLNDRVELMATKEAFITLKSNFLSKDQLTKKKDRILIKDLISNTVNPLLSPPLSNKPPLFRGGKLISPPSLLSPPPPPPPPILILHKKIND